MVDTNIVRLAIEYLDSCLSAGAEATLVGMHWYIDGRNKTLPLLDEVNEALRQRPEVLVTRLARPAVARGLCWFRQRQWHR